MKLTHKKRCVVQRVSRDGWGNSSKTTVLSCDSLREAMAVASFKTKQSGEIHVALEEYTYEVSREPN